MTAVAIEAVAARTGSPAVAPGGATDAPAIVVEVASTPWRRLRGLAFLPRAEGRALLLPRTRAVHTFAMRFTLDLVWLDGDGGVVRVDRDVPPRRHRACRAAAAVLEAPAGEAEAALAALSHARAERWPVCGAAARLAALTQAPTHIAPR